MSHWIVLTPVRSGWIFQSSIFEVIGLPQSSSILDSSLTVQELTGKLCTYIKLCNFVFFQARLTYFGFENVIEWVCYVTGPVFVF